MCDVFVHVTTFLLIVCIVPKEDLSNGRRKRARSNIGKKNIKYS